MEMNLEIYDRLRGKDIYAKVKIVCYPEDFETSEKAAREAYLLDYNVWTEDENGDLEREIIPTFEEIEPIAKKHLIDKIDAYHSEQLEAERNE